jgi:hypothetical protein
MGVGAVLSAGVRAPTHHGQACGLWRHGGAKGVRIVIDSDPPGEASFDVEKINYAYNREGRHEPKRGGGRGSQQKRGDIISIPQRRYTRRRMGRVREITNKREGLLETALPYGLTLRRLLFEIGFYRY